MDWCPIHTIDRVEYFSRLFDNRAKVIFYLKARSFKQYLAVAPFPSRSYNPEKLSGLRIRVYKYGLFGPQGAFHKTSLKLQILAK